MKSQSAPSVEYITDPTKREDNEKEMSDIVRVSFPEGRTGLFSVGWSQSLGRMGTAAMTAMSLAIEKIDDRKLTEGGSI